MPYSTKLLKQLEKLEPNLKAVLLDVLAEIERNREESIGRSEFLDFARDTQENFQNVWSAIHELSENQKQIQATVNELVEAQKRTEKRLDELAEAQKQTERKVAELAEAQKQTERKIAELTEAQVKTEKTLNQLLRRVDRIEDNLGGLSNTVGYQLEDRAYPALKKILTRDYAFEIDRLYRKNIVYSKDHFDEINIYGEARKNGNKIFIIGESKAQFGVKDVRKFKKLFERVRSHLGGEIFPLVIAYHYHPEAEAQLQENGIKHFWSYELTESQA